MKTFEMIKKGIRTLNSILFVGACILLGLLIVFMTYEVFMRYVLNSPTQWTYEINGYLYVGMVLLGLGYAQSQDKHMKMDLVTTSFHGKKRNVLHAVLAFLGACYAALLLVFGWKYAYAALVKGSKAPSTFASLLWPSYMALPVGALGLTLECLVESIENILALFVGDGADESAPKPTSEAE